MSTYMEKIGLGAIPCLYELKRLKNYLLLIQSYGSNGFQKKHY